MVKLPDLPAVRLKGPFWSAEADVIKLAEPTVNNALRALFADVTQRRSLDEPNVLLPDTLLVLCWVRKVMVAPAGNISLVWQRSGGTKPDGKLSPAALRTAISSGQLALLLVASDPLGWPKSKGQDV